MCCWLARQFLFYINCTRCSLDTNRRFHVMQRQSETITVIGRLAVTNNLSAASLSLVLLVAPHPSVLISTGASPVWLYGGDRSGGGIPAGLADVPCPLLCQIQLGSAVSDTTKLGFCSAVRLGKLPVDVEHSLFPRKKKELIICLKS